MRASHIGAGPRASTNRHRELRSGNGRPEIGRGRVNGSDIRQSSGTITPLHDRRMHLLAARTNPACIHHVILSNRTASPRRYGSRTRPASARSSQPAAHLPSPLEGSIGLRRKDREVAGTGGHGPRTRCRQTAAGRPPVRVWSSWPSERDSAAKRSGALPDSPAIVPGPDNPAALEVPAGDDPDMMPPDHNHVFGRATRRRSDASPVSSQP